MMSDSPMQLRWPLGSDPTARVQRFTEPLHGDHCPEHCVLPTTESMCVIDLHKSGQRPSRATYGQ
jgi:hypothetical protein